ncbi:MAG: hypothetical protein KF729_19740 [Sandaracinaceae bacterium]|nr:hypothetical protein [Sandaracinaceae bacterium]
MPVTGLVAHLRGDPSGWPETIARLGADARVTVGPREGGRVALVTETTAAAEDAALFAALEATEGVSQLFVVFHDFSDVPEIEGTVPRRLRGRPCSDET